MICVLCISMGLTSTVGLYNCHTTLMGVSHYFDETGRAHVHDPNVTRCIARCSNGHEWSTESKRPCPACATPRGDR